ncbi:uncharacterized protein EDB91DRAFT_1111352 [Suillus paluster]|uniref:uncharacterized protein n=1 Tax=Suillus paluster TaxID=48578 RepID=UPI001B8702A0|nr:uncharacterized protein EDB91DRAFT_1111352 [Suillus paluster]KAG1748907.1 hypothetical protein EDB91DRAFT_1111352 [Suillus paluster]
MPQLVAHQLIAGAFIYSCLPLVASSFRHGALAGFQGFVIYCWLPAAEYMLSLMSGRRLAAQLIWFVTVLALCREKNCVFKNMIEKDQ